MRRTHRLSCLIATALATLVLAAPAAAADEDEVVVEQTAATTATCQDPVLVNPFADLGDYRDYVLAPSGDFENAALEGWQLEGGAVTTIDEDGDGALSLPAGSIATSPAMCIDLNYPTARFHVRNEAEDGDFEVQVMYVDHKKAYKPHKVKKLKGRRGWAATEDIKIDPERGGKEAGWRRVAFRFVADEHKGDFRIDNLYVDPRMRG
jgi:hypothetical protein